MSGCLPCALEEIDDGAVVFRDDLWACEVVPGFDVPGWFVLRVRRHAERLTGLNGEELSTYGHRLRDVVAAVTEVTGAPAVYQLTFGEANPHFHTLVAPRGADLPPEHWMGGLLSLLPEHSDNEAARALVPAVAEAYGRSAAGIAS